MAVGLEVGALVLVLAPTLVVTAGEAILRGQGGSGAQDSQGPAVTLTKEEMSGCVWLLSGCSPTAVLEQWQR